MGDPRIALSLLAVVVLLGALCWPPSPVMPALGRLAVTVTGWLRLRPALPLLWIITTRPGNGLPLASVNRAVTVAVAPLYVEWADGGRYEGESTVQG